MKSCFKKSMVFAMLTFLGFTLGSFICPVCPFEASQSFNPIQHATSRKDGTKIAGANYPLW